MHRARTAVLLGLAALAQGCVDSGPGPSPWDDFAPGIVDVEDAGSGAEEVPRDVPPRDPRLWDRGVDVPVVVVTLDGVRWQEIFEGTDASRGSFVTATSLLPNLHALGTDRGAFIGAPGRGTISASGPNYVSLPGYTELLGGRASRCADNDCARITVPSLLDESRAAGAKVAAFASWERLDLATTAHPGAFHVSCGRHGDAQIEPWPGHGDYRPDRFTADVALAYYQAERPDVFFLGLGDPDELAHRGDYPGYVAALRHADDVIGRLVAILERDERGRSTHVIVTADHGRASDFNNHGAMPEAARVWAVASGPRFLARGAVLSPHPRRLADVTPTLRLVLGLPPDDSERAGAPIDELFHPLSSE